jgi:hypothetical protein
VARRTSREVPRHRAVPRRWRRAVPRRRGTPSTLRRRRDDEMSHRRHATELTRRTKKKKNVFRSTSRRNTPRKNRRPATPHAATDMERPGDKNTRRPAAEINVRRGRARRLGDGAPTFYATTNLYWRLVLVYAAPQMLLHAFICNVSYQRSGRGGRLTTAAPPSATAGRSPAATSGTASAAPGRSRRSTRLPPITP